MEHTLEYILSDLHGIILLFKHVWWLAICSGLFAYGFIKLIGWRKKEGTITRKHKKEFEHLGVK